MQVSAARCSATRGWLRRQPIGYACAVNYAQLLFPDFSLILIGYLVCRYTALNRAVWQPVESLVYYFLFPTLLFYSIIRSPIDWQGTSNLMLAGVGTGLTAIAITYTLPHWPLLGKRLDARDAAASAQVAFRFNSFIGLALADRLAGAQGLQLISVLIGVCVPLFNIAAVYPMAKGSQTGFVRELMRNPLILATLAGLSCNLLGLHLPAVVEPTIARIGQASIALGLMSAGAGMQLGLLTKSLPLSISVLSVRHVLTPLIALVAAHWLRLSPLQASILLTFSALPTASTCYVLAARMGYNGAYVAGLVTLSTICGVASLPFALSLLAWWPV